MMDKRMILAIVLVGAVLALHFLVIMPWLTPPPPKKTVVVDNGTKGDVPRAIEPTDNATAPKTPVTPAKSAEPVPHANEAAMNPAPVAEGPYVAEHANPIQPLLVLESDSLTTRWTNKYTGSCDNVTFKGFRTNVKHGDNLTILGGFESLIVGENDKPKTASMALDFPELAKALADNMTMRVSEHDSSHIVFVGKIKKRDSSGDLHDFIEVTKTVRLSKKKYEIEVGVSVKNLTAEALNFKYDLRAVEGMNVEPGLTLEKTATASEYKANTWANITYRSEGGYPTLKKELVSSLKQPMQEGTGNVVWAGLSDRYFATAAWAERDGNLLPLSQATIEAIKVELVSNPEPVESARVRLTSNLKDLAPQAADVRTFHLFAGPKESEVLDSYDNLGFPKLVDYGWFSFIAIPIVWLLRGIYFLVRNYGVAILLMTAIIRVALHPLTKKGQVAMAKMQRLKPKIQELQKRFKNDKQKLAQEQMKLFRESGVSPMSGCLPMLLQLPVLYALFTALQVAFELRQSPFVFWMSDLSRPDAVMDLHYTIPIVGIHTLNILPILMTAAMFIQQLMQPKAEDEQTRQQQKMMMFLPFLFMFMFYGFPAGLNLYWFASTVIGIGEQWYIQRHINETLGPATRTA